MTPFSFVREVGCVVCEKRAARVEICAPGDHPVEYESMSEVLQAVYREHLSLDSWRFAYEGVEAGNGLGVAIETSMAATYCEAFALPLAYERVRGAGLFDDAGFCSMCQSPYCFNHWNERGRPSRRCPEGHSRSLDPHWSLDL